jgi:creatinine amidohydrolase
MIEMNRKSCSAVVFFLFGAVMNAGQHAQAQTSPPHKLSVHWEELTGPDFIEAVKRAQGTFLLPFGIMEKHGPHMPQFNRRSNREAPRVSFLNGYPS